MKMIFIQSIQKITNLPILTLLHHHLKYDPEKIETIKSNNGTL
jgi:hypothetical protein